MGHVSHWEHLLQRAQFGLACGRFSNNRFVFVNEAFAQQRGYVAEELVRQPIFAVIASEEHQAVDERLAEVKRQGRLAFESVHKRKDGTEFPVLVEVTAVTGEGLDPDLWVAYALDISEHRRAEQGIVRMMHAIAQAGDVVAHINSEGRFMYVNDVMCRLFGYSRQELLSMAVPDVDVQFTLERYRELFDRAREGPQGPFESVIRKKDGSLFPAEIVVSRIDVDHTPLLMGILRDLSSRRNAEAKLRQSEERFRLVAEVTNDVLWDWDLITDNHWWSPNAREKFGYDPAKEPSIVAWRSRLHPDDRGRVLHHVDACLQSGERTYFDEYRFRLADGSYGHFLDKGQVVHDAEGRPVRMIGTMIDITSLKRSYESLQSAYNRLQRMSRELQMAEDNERRRLSRELHDEFGQLLSALRLNLARAGEELERLPILKGARLKRNVLTATKTAERLFAALRDLVHGLRPELLDERGFVAALQSMATDIQESTGLECRVLADPKNVDSRIGQELKGTLFRIAQELVTNVVRHANATKAEITVHCVDDKIVLSVQDNGRGGRLIISNKKYGLRGVRERVELLGGMVEIRSERRKGTVVTITVPVELRVRFIGQVDSPQLPVRTTKPKRRRHGNPI